MRRYIPNQHGAWAMLVVPFLLGMFTANPGWIHLLFFIGWLLAYLFSYPLLQWMKTGKSERYRQPVVLFAAVLLPVAAALLWLRPELIWYGLMLVPLFTVNTYFARRNRERAFWNDIAAIVQFCTVVYPAYALGEGDDWRLAAELAVVCFLYFAGTVFYVKTMIRERGNPIYYAGSVGYHVVLLVLSVCTRPYLLLLPLGLVLVRAVICPKTRMSIKQSGILEVGISVIVLISVLIVYV